MESIFNTCLDNIMFKGIFNLMNKPYLNAYSKFIKLDFFITLM